MTGPGMISWFLIICVLVSSLVTASETCDSCGSEKRMPCTDYLAEGDFKYATDVTLTDGVPVLFELSLTQCKNSFIALSSSNDPSATPEYVINIGSRNNDAIILSKSGFSVVKSQAENLLQSCSSSTPDLFWLTYKDGMLRLGSGHTVGENLLLVDQDDSSPALIYFGLSGLHRPASTWCVFPNPTMCELLTPLSTWSSVSSTTASADGTVTVTCDTGYIHPQLLTKDFDITCISPLYYFEICEACVEGCEINIDFSANNFQSLDYTALLGDIEGAIECVSGYSIGDCETIQTFECDGDGITSLQPCSVVRCLESDLDYSTNNWQTNGDHCVEDGDSLVVQCTDGYYNSVTGNDYVTLGCGSSGWTGIQTCTVGCGFGQIDFSNYNTAYAGSAVGVAEGATVTLACTGSLALCDCTNSQDAACTSGELIVEPCTVERCSTTDLDFASKNWATSGDVCIENTQTITVTCQDGFYNPADGSDSVTLSCTAVGWSGDTACTAGCSITQMDFTKYSVAYAGSAVGVANTGTVSVTCTGGLSLCDCTDTQSAVCTGGDLIVEPCTAKRCSTTSLDFGTNKWQSNGDSCIESGETLTLQCSDGSYNSADGSDSVTLSCTDSGWTGDTACTAGCSITQMDFTKYSVAYAGSDVGVADAATVSLTCTGDLLVSDCTDTQAAVCDGDQLIVESCTVRCPTSALDFATKEWQRPVGVATCVPLAENDNLIVQCKDGFYNPTDGSDSVTLQCTAGGWTGYTACTAGCDGIASFPFSAYNTAYSGSATFVAEGGTLTVACTGDNTLPDCTTTQDATCTGGRLFVETCSVSGGCCDISTFDYASDEIVDPGVVGLPTGSTITLKCSGDTYVRATCDRTQDVTCDTSGASLSVTRCQARGGACGRSSRSGGPP